VLEPSRDRPSPFSRKEKTMKNFSASIKTLWALLLLIPCISCQTVNNQYPVSDCAHSYNEVEPGHLLTIQRNINSKLETFKGIGNLKLVNGDKKLNLRAAWMGTRQGNLRVEIFGFPGQSAARYSNDGHYSYLYLPLENRFYVTGDVNLNLKKILTLAITSNDLHAFLSGKFPVADYAKEDANLAVSKDEYILNLKKGCFGKRKKLYIDSRNQTAWKLESYTLFGSLQYRTELKKFQKVNGYIIPFEIIISDNQGNRLSIFPDKYWTDTPVSLSSFTLTPPK